MDRVQLTIGVRRRRTRGSRRRERGAVRRVGHRLAWRGRKSRQGSVTILRGHRPGSSGTVIHVRPCATGKSDKSG